MNISCRCRRRRRLYLRRFLFAAQTDSKFRFLSLTWQIGHVLRSTTNRTHRSSDHDCSPSMPAFSRQPDTEKGDIIGGISGPPTTSANGAALTAAIVRTALAWKRKERDRVV